MNTYTVKPSELTQAELYEALLAVVGRIERCGGSKELTHAVNLCHDVLMAVGNQYNPANAYAAERVRNESLRDRLLRICDAHIAKIKSSEAHP